MLLTICLLLPFLFIQNEGVEWLTPLEHDFGDLEFQKEVEYSFEFKNISDEPILIDNVRPTCGCTTPDWSYDPILPDSISNIRVVFDANKKGYFRKKIIVFFSNQRKSDKLYIEGFVE